jgi:hypothetical protein
MRKVPESKVAEEILDPIVTPRKRRAELPSVTGHGEKNRKPARWS